MSSDELANFGTQSPQVAGPSTSNKRKRRPDSKKGSHAAIKNVTRRVEQATEPSSDNEPPPRQKVRRGKALSANIVVNGHEKRSAPLSKGKMKSPQPELNKTANSNKDSDISLHESTDEDEGIAEKREIPSSRPGKKKAVDIPPARWQKMHDDVVKQRDDFARQFEQLLQLRHTDTEKLSHEQKIQYEARLKAQQETIHELQTAFNRMDNLGNLGKGPLHFLTREAAERERQDVQREVGRLRNILKEKDAALNEKNEEINKLNDTIKTLRSDLKMEVENSKRLKAQTSLSKASGKLDSRNALIVRLYEELTGILIPNVKHDLGKYKDDDAIFTCVQTARDATASLHFTLKYSTVSDEDTIIQKVIYTPFDLEKETASFIEQLDFLAKPFTFERDQMQVFSQTLTSHLEGNPGDDNDISRMEK